MRFALFLAAWMAFWAPPFAQASPPTPPRPVILTDNQAQYPLGKHLDILVDPTGELTIEDVASPEYAAQFVPSQVSAPNYGYTNRIVWVRLNLVNETRQANQWLLEDGFANTQFVDLYTPLPEGGFALKQAGVLRPAATRDVSHPHTVFNLLIPPHSQQTYYLRFQNGASMTLPLTLWEQNAFLNHSLSEQIWMGIFYGILIGLLFYNLFLLFSLRELNYLYLVIVLAFFILEELSYDGFAFYLLPSSLGFFKIYLQPLAFSLLLASMVLFSDSFLEVKAQLPKLHRINQIILAAWCALILLIPFSSYHLMAQLAVPWSLVSLAGILIAGFTSWKRGFRPARFFMLAWFGLLVGSIWVLLVRLGWVPSTSFNENVYRLGYLWMAVFWSIALADRINLLKAETERANRELQNGEHRLSQILEGLPLGVVVYGADHKPSYANQRTVELLINPGQGIQADIGAGRTLEQAIDYFSLERAGGDQSSLLEITPVHSALEGTPASADDIQANLGDRKVPLEIWASPVRDGAGNVESAVVTVQDITRRKNVEAELAEYRKSLEKLVEKRTAELSVINAQLHSEATERKKLEQSLYQRIEWLSTLNRIRQAINSTADLPQAYEKLSNTILQLLDAGTVLIVRWDEHRAPFEVHCHALESASTPAQADILALFQTESPLRREIELGKIIPLSAEQAANLPPPFGECFQSEGFCSLLLAPLATRQAIVGVLGITARQPVEDFTAYQINMVEKMAVDLADLSQDAFLLDQALMLAATEERNRLARDLHDSVTQVLFSACLVADVLPKIWSRDPERAAQSLEKLRRLTHGALAEMRTMLLELRPSALINTSLAELLTQLSEAITSRAGLPSKLSLHKISDLPADVHTNFYRIAQEALNNVVKHAQANLVKVSLSEDLEPHDQTGFKRRAVSMVIQDDGVGFSIEDGKPERLGFGIMRERAATIHGALSIESKLGYGTKVTLTWMDESGTL